MSGTSRTSRKKGNRKSYRRTAFARLVFQLLTLALFVAATVTGAIQLWFLVFGAGVLVSLRWSRLYCGWVCPMNTLFRPIRFLFERIGLRRVQPSSGMKRPWIRYAALMAFVIVAVAQKGTGVTIPLLPLLTALAVLITLYVDEMWWHAHLCPFGTILDVTSRPARHAIVVEEDRCIGCGKCDAVCPTDAIHHVERDDKRLPVRVITHHGCLACFRCAQVCPVGAISWTERPGRKSA